MNSTLDNDLCRISVTGPRRKVDLAVPSGTPVATLLPILLLHTATAGPATDADGAAGWVLQRVGEAPFDLAGTPESLDWLEGEELVLRPAEDPLPELDFDDLADGIATSVNRRADRWQPHHRRRLFLALAAVTLGLLGYASSARGPLPAQVAGTAVLAVACGAAALRIARRLADPALSLVFAVASAAFAALAAAAAVDGAPERIAVTAEAGSAAAVAATAVAVLLIVAQRTVAPALPLAPFLVVIVAALVVVCVISLHATMGMSAERAAAVAATAVVVAVVLAPRAAIRMSGLRGPQLPKTGADMTVDIEPAPSDEVRDRTYLADTYLTVTMVVAALLLPVLFLFVMATPGWVGWTLVTVLASAVLLRARTFTGLWQRVALVAAGGSGFLLVVTTFAARATPGARLGLLVALACLVVALVLAAIRPWPRRMLPIWEYLATFFDVTTGLAVLPLLAHVLGVYAWARGLFG
ncbi:type VII secretion integral membrane protein EccD [Micromonospora haikouensis]|uniref:type VII secretion integral membrane protein EccD n=1 Tax=Micromonospora haikouensis TaxID=686309 RepID=UPI0037AAB8EC